MITNDNKQNTELLKDIIRNPFVWPGGYARFAITTDGGVLCYECLRDEYQNILHSTKYRYNDGWEVSGQITQEEMIYNFYCDHCNRRVEDL